MIHFAGRKDHSERENSVHKVGRSMEPGGGQEKEGGGRTSCKEEGGYGQ